MESNKVNYVKKAMQNMSQGKIFVMPTKKEAMRLMDEDKKKAAARTATNNSKQYKENLNDEPNISS
ncbi:MAG: hypothetical protein NE328_19200 [Lentisphaeraceae bacterium]|nr:hypothetical protein [Lentisphaeraceae bacterium]